MGEACGMHGKEEKRVKGFGGETAKEGALLEDLGVHGQLTKRFLKRKG
jgi:hypothetical protein